MSLNLKFVSNWGLLQNSFMAHLSPHTHMHARTHMHVRAHTSTHQGTAHNLVTYNLCRPANSSTGPWKHLVSPYTALNKDTQKPESGTWRPYTSTALDTPSPRQSSVAVSTKGEMGGAQNPQAPTACPGGSHFAVVFASSWCISKEPPLPSAGEDSSSGSVQPFK